MKLETARTPNANLRTPAPKSILFPFEKRGLDPRTDGCDECDPHDQPAHESPPWPHTGWTERYTFLRVQTSLTAHRRSSTPTKVVASGVSCFHRSRLTSPRQLSAILKTAETLLAKTAVRRSFHVHFFGGVCCCCSSCFSFISIISFSSALVNLGN